MKKKYLIVALLSGTLVLGTTVTANAKAKTKVDRRQTVVNVALKPTSESSLTDYVYHTVDPTSSDFHHYLSPGEFADKFGQSTDYLQAFKKYLSGYHLSATVYPGNLALKIKGTKANVNQAFKAKYVRQKGLPSKTTYKLPGKLSKQVVAVIGVYAPNPKTHSKKSTKSTKKSPTKKSFTKLSSLKDIGVPISDTKPNTDVTGNAFSRKYGALKFANRYHLTSLYNQGLEGQGQRIGIITHADFRMGDIKTYLKQVGLPDDTSRIHRIYPVGSKKAARSLTSKILTPYQAETSLDVQSASSVAPKAQIDVYIGQTNNDATSTPSMHYTSFMTAISENNDKQLTTSFGPGVELAKSWTDHSASLQQYTHAFNLMLEQAAAQGITVFRASGDYGRSESPIGKENHVMSTSPYQVIVGGTTLPYTKIIHDKIIKVTKERAWGDSYSASPAEIKAGVFPGSGGGFSALNPTPRYQLGVPGVNTFRAITLLKYLGKGHYAINKHPKVITGTGNARNLPDVSGNADSQTGYATYVSGNQLNITHKSFKLIPKKIWTIGGGTSYVAPQMAAANAVMNTQRSNPIGFWNPQIYKFAQQADTPFHVLDDADNNNNLYYTGQPGKLYNQATGLGTIDFEKLYAKFNDENAR